MAPSHPPRADITRHGTIKKTWESVPMLISLSGLGVPTGKISNAVSPRQMDIQYSHVENMVHEYTP